jgi:hypothetical protein
MKKIMNEKLTQNRNYMRNINIFLVFFNLFFAGYGLHAQVTMGSDAPPKKGAILDLNENASDASNQQVNSTKGLSLPRVKLETMNSLSPAIPDYTAGTTDSTHAGLTVYNVNTASPFVEGIYTWNGKEWIYIIDGAGTWKTGGNTGTNAAVNYLGTFDNQPLILKTNNKEGLRISASGNIGINTPDPNTPLDVNGELTVRDVKELNLVQGNLARQLYINTNTGLVGLQPAGEQAVSPIFFASTDRTVLNGPPNSSILSEFNNCENMVLAPVNDDIVLNNIEITLNSGKNAFRIGESGTYQIAGALNFFFATPKEADRVYINTRMEKSTDGGNSWNSITGIRPILIIDWYSGQYTSVNLPITVQPLQAGDLIRIVFNRTKAGGTMLQGSSVTELRVALGYSTPAYTVSLTRL